MKIVHIITRLILGGAQENTLLTVDGLHHTFGDDVTLLTGPAEGPEGDLFGRAKERGLKVEVVPELVRAIRPRTDWRAYRVLRSAIRRLAPEVVHTHSSKAGIVGRAAAWEERVPAVVHTIHGLPFGPSESPMKNRAYIAMERWAARRCHKIVSVADAMTEQALAAGVGRPEQYVTIYSGMDVDPFLSPPRPREFIRKQLGLAEGEVAFATVARLFERKGHDDLLDIMADVAATTPRVRYVWIGGGIWRDRLEARARELGVRDRIIFTGLVPPDRIPELLGACDAVVHPSYREGLARVLPQGLIAGLPVISYDVDGAREVCITGETGFLVPFRDRQALRQAIEKLAASAELRCRLGAEGRSRFADPFRHETMTRSIRSLYEQLLASPPGHGGGA
jgi:glycosyltransferase involved in cell wall biosynthesis